MHGPDLCGNACRRARLLAHRNANADHMGGGRAGADRRFGARGKPTLRASLQPTSPRGKELGLGDTAKPRPAAPPAPAEPAAQLDPRVLGATAGDADCGEPAGRPVAVAVA